MDSQKHHYSVLTAQYRKGWEHERKGKDRSRKGTGGKDKKEMRPVFGTRGTGMDVWTFTGSPTVTFLKIRGRPYFLYSTAL